MPDCLVSALISIALLHDARHAELDAFNLGHDRAAKWTGMCFSVVGMSEAMAGLTLLSLMAALQVCRALSFAL